MSASNTQLDRRPRNKTDLGLGYEFNRFVSANLGGSYYGLYSDNGTNLGRYFILNAGLTARRDDRHATLSLNVDNVFDRLYQEENGYPMPGRTLRVEMNYDF